MTPTKKTIEFGGFSPQLSWQGNVEKNMTPFEFILVSTHHEMAQMDKTW